MIHHQRVFGVTVIDVMCQHYSGQKISLVFKACS